MWNAPCLVDSFLLSGGEGDGVLRTSFRECVSLRQISICDWGHVKVKPPTIAEHGLNLTCRWCIDYVSEGRRLPTKAAYPSWVPGGQFISLVRDWCSEICTGEKVCIYFGPSALANLLRVLLPVPLHSPMFPYCCLWMTTACANLCPLTLECRGAWRFSTNSDQQHSASWPIRPLPNSITSCDPLVCVRSAQMSSIYRKAPSFPCHPHRASCKLVRRQCIFVIIWFAFNTASFNSIWLQCANILILFLLVWLLICCCIFGLWSWHRQFQ